MGSKLPPDILEDWAQLSVSSRSPSCDWGPVESILNAAEAYSLTSKSKLANLLSESDQVLNPLRDPLWVDFGLHRWLDNKREENYSDWLAWIVSQLKSEEILALLCPADLHIAECCRHALPQVNREVSIPGGRLDITIHLGAETVIVVEVKKTSAEVADTAKQEHYADVLAGESTRYAPRVLLVVEGESDEYEGAFKRLRWNDLCISLRRMSPELQRRLGSTTAAMILGFIGAVEQNLLGLVSPHTGYTGRTLLYGKTARHIERSLLAEDSSEMKTPRDKDADVLLARGIDSYSQALNAISEFESIALDELRTALEDLLAEVGNGMSIDISVSDFKEYKWPDKLKDTLTYGGKDASLGFQKAEKPIGCWHSFYLWWHENKCHCVAEVDFSNTPTAKKASDALRQHSQKYPIQLDGAGVYLSKAVSPDEESFNQTLRTVLREWASAWKRAGGLKEFAK